MSNLAQTKYYYHSVTTWDFDGLSLEAMIEALKSNIEQAKTKLGSDSTAVTATVCDIDDGCISFRLERPMTEAEILAQEDQTAREKQEQVAQDRVVFEALKVKHGW